MMPDDFLNFAPELPERASFVGTLQTAFDSTSLGALKSCPREYYYSIVCGIIPADTSVHLAFGIWYHGAMERYDHKRAEGISHEDAILDALQWLLTVTWEARRNRPWISDHETKNRYTLVRAVLDRLDHYDDENEALQTVIMPNGKPAVELSFSYNTSYTTPQGLPYKYCGHIDRLATMHGMTYVIDYKSTSIPLNDNYYAQYTPNNQMSGYYFSGNIIFKEPINGIMIDAVQIKKAGDDYEFNYNRRPIYRTVPQLDEWYKDLGYYFAQAEAFSRANYWPMNDKACVRGFTKCSYFEICKHAPEVRGTWAKTGWTRRWWDPLKQRGDI